MQATMKLIIALFLPRCVMQQSGGYLDRVAPDGLNFNGDEGPPAFGTAIEELNEVYLSKDGKLVLDFLQAIHAAEKRQAEPDAHAFAEEKRGLKVFSFNSRF
ncbi:hypothetical protein COLO4_35617 [Corchorus olitorius]|uniref:Uncharacterized protein n=1 Tax=Corchorus olitorius TaxID=93759 RepID=A0A1R3GEN1_9ROSI|nr:hypothetical protein COLO4_35617 [Corchorus olitorius]